MELKAGKIKADIRAMVRFNRTFMELKVCCGACCYNCLLSFNRTFMELKGDRLGADVRAATFQSHLYGIERKDRILLKWCSGSVSIAPLWNWKVSGDATLSHDVEFQSHLYGIESKDIYFRAIRACVSIAPLWNWKATRTELGQYQHCFNRTFMELKVSFSPLPWYVCMCFNRTFMELKVAVGVFRRFKQHSFNRTFMELKGRGPPCMMIAAWFQSHLYGIESVALCAPFCWCSVSIAPLWNWKYAIWVGNYSAKGHGGVSSLK